MTSYNAENFIAEAIKSILNQSLKDLEFIIVDNRSSDKTAEIIQSFKDERIVFIQNEENLGQTKALNLGIRKAKAKYIARMDADDISYPDRLKKQFQYLELNPGVALVGSWCMDINEKGDHLKLYKVPMDPFWIRCCLSSSGELTSWCVTHPSIMVRRKIFDEVGLYNEEKSQPGYPQDYELWWKIARKGDIANIPEPLLKYRILKSSESKSFSDETSKYCFDIALDKVHQIMPECEESRLHALALMLENLPQNSKEEGRGILRTFEKYLFTFMGEQNSGNQLIKACSRIQLYYLPVLSKTNLVLSLRTHLKLILHFPSFLFDGKYYRKVIKALLKSFFSNKKYGMIKRKLLFQR